MGQNCESWQSQRRQMSAKSSPPWRDQFTIISILAAFSFLLSPTFGSPLDVKVTAEIASDSGPPPLSVHRPVLQPRIHNVSVGPSGDHRFILRYVQADIGDMIRFSFSEGNHTVTESTFMSPCSPGGAFDTNFFHGSSKVRERSEMTIVVDTSNPRWFFCRQEIPTSHCQSGMVFAINPGPHWIDFAARARNRNTTEIGPHSEISRLPLASGKSTRTGRTHPTIGSGPESTSTVVEDLTRTRTVATTTISRHLRWSTQTITSMITTTFSVSQ